MKWLATAVLVLLLMGGSVLVVPAVHHGSPVYAFPSSPIERR